MALSVTDQPQEFSPAYNDLVYIALSTLAPNVVYTNTVNVTYPASIPDVVLKYNPRPDNYLYSDAHRIIENYCTHDFDFTVGADKTFMRAPNSWVRYRCDLAEDSSVTSGLVKFAFNACLDQDAWINYDEDTYLFSSGSTGTLFLTNSPRNISIGLTDRYNLGIMMQTYVGYCPANDLEINTYDINGNLIDTLTRTNYEFDGNLDDNKFLNLLVGPHDINTAIDPAPALITSAVAYYTVQLKDSIGPYKSELFTFTIDTECSEYEPQRLFFLNNWGRFDAFTFKQAKQEFTEYDKSYYKKYTGEISGGLWVRNTYDRAISQFNTLKTESRIINSDWITEEESAWLEELISSPVVYLYDNGNFYSVNIRQPQYERKFYKNSELFNLQITIEFSIQNERQRA